MNIINKIDSYLTEKPKPKKPDKATLERYAKEVIRIFQVQGDWEDGEGRGGDIQSIVQDFAVSHNLDAEDFFTVVMKVAKKMNVRL